MKSLPLFSAVVLAALSSAGMLYGQNRATQNPATQNPTATQQEQVVGPNDTRVAGNNVRASKLIGMNIQNAGGESVGEVNDIVLDGQTGKIRYVAVTYGGFLGIGNKMFAVPYEAFRWRTAADSRGEHMLMLNVTQKQLEGAVGFDENSWPNFADPKYTEDLDKRYGVTRQPQAADPVQKP
jgi:sporulation protein YlmC with PRC-barrel domain